MTTRRTGQRVLGLLGVGAFGAVTALATLAPGAAGTAGAATGNSGNTGSGSAAIVTPLLKFFYFGNQVGLPLLCSDSGSIVSIIGSQTGGAKVTSPLVSQLDTQCAQLSAQGGPYLQQAIARSSQLALINPVVDPLIGDLSTGAQTVGTQYGPSLAPFGPTVAGLGGTVAFFEGT
jgi:hypothetical protein